MSITQTTRNIYFDGGNCTTVDEWKAYLAEQYAEGTPVVIVYPLAEEKKESVKSQSMMLADGHNTIRRESSVSGLEMTCCYKQKPKEEEGGGEIFSFTIGDETHQYRSGMTWFEWCESEFNNYLDGYATSNNEDDVYKYLTEGWIGYFIYVYHPVTELRVKGGDKIESLNYQAWSN